MTTQLDPGSRGAGAAPSEVVLTVDDLTVSAGGVSLVKDVSFSLASGERVGLIGESGSGKSLTVTSLMGLLGEGLQATGSIRLAGVPHDLVGASPKELAKLRGSQMTMVFQEPMTALNPTMRVADQVAEVMLVHKTAGSRSAANEAAVELLERVHLPDPQRAAKAYPHQLSGGQRQRVVLAIALANDPKVLLCDEPTTALDVTVQAQMLDLIAAGVAERNAALLFITHDLAVVATICERVLVMYGGRIVEAGPVGDVFRNPRHRYTEGLLAASDLESSSADGRLNTIPGTVPAAGRFPSGCVFRNRCAHADQKCAELPAWMGAAAHGHACWHPGGTDER